MEDKDWTPSGIAWIPEGKTITADLIDKFYYEDALFQKTGSDFHLSDCDGKKVQGLRCIFCGTTRFIVAVGSYKTVIKCPNCEYEICIHDG